MAKSRRPNKGQLKEIQNNTNRRQSVFDSDGVAGDEGTRYDIEPYDVKTVPKKVADIFLRDRAQYVSEYIPAPIPRKEGDPDVWLANATGSPFYPKTVTVERIVKGERTAVDVENPLAKAAPIRRTMMGGFEVIPTEDGQDKMPWPKPNLVFDFPPFRRLPVSFTYANWNIERDMRQLDHHRGKLVTCAKPRDFEPNDSWSLTMLQAYAECLGVDEFRNYPEMLGKNEDEYDHPDELDAARELLLRALYFVLLEDVLGPTEQDFNAYLSLFEARQKKPQEKVKSPGPERLSV